MTTSIHQNNKIILDMTQTKKYNEKIKLDRWNGYNIKIIKDGQSCLEKLNEILLRRRIHRDMVASKHL